MQMIKRLFLMLAVSFSTFAADENVTAFEVKDYKADKQFLESWSLTQEEYDRYLFLKNNTPRGYYTKSHPLFYLGIEARTEEERKKYARLIAKMEFENFEKVQSFSKEIQKQSLALYGNGDILDLESLKDDPVEKALSTPSKKVGFVSFLYVTKSCIKPCEQALKEEISKLVSGESAQLHIIFPKNHSEQDINRWAFINKVPVELNNRNVILLRSVREGDDESITKFPTVTSKLI